MNDILARRARRATVGIALSAALVAGIAPATAIAAETSSPTGAAVSQTSATNGNSGAPQTEDAAAAKEKAYATMQEALKHLEAAKDAAGPEILETIEHVITDLQSLRDRMLKEADDSRGPLLYLQAQVNEAQARYDAAHNQVSNLQTELDKACNDGAPAETINQLRHEIATAERQEYSCQAVLNTYRTRLESQESVVAKFEANAEKCQTDIDEETAKRDALLDDLEKAQAAYDDACKAYEEAKAAADKATSPEITKPAETVPPSGSTQPAEATPPVASPATGKDALPSSTKQANSSSGKQANATAGKLANTGDTAPSAIALAGIAAAGLGITATATRRIKNSK